ncbi:uncharacterized protein LOC111829459 [Capsella rubella]|uniref:uncharacterized protein LOC111829459 n=1 Tax=Capsella rubella TaxID=81985 RepID=UPI000CD5110E|nr:uncharacterized protein LOC111829459 [Capsella rubella]
MMSHSSCSDANLSRSWGPHYNCGRVTTVAKSWTNENPGRRFFRCVVHGFINWAHEEKPNGWQKVSLLEAREEIKVLKESLRAKNEQIGSGSNNVSCELVKKHEDEKNKLQSEVMVANEREKCLGNSSCYLGKVSLLSLQ